MAFHIERLQELMTREIAALLIEDEVVQHAHALVTVSRIEMDRSVQNAKIFMRIYPDTDAAKILLHLHEIAPDIRHTLGRRIFLKSIPRLNFFLDVEEEAQT
jgi:ribosome-binding factor A